MEPFEVWKAAAPLKDRTAAERRATVERVEAIIVVMLFALFLSDGQRRYFRFVSRSTDFREQPTHPLIG